jgi:hypothetical protein
MRRINTVDELKAERKRLNAYQVQLEVDLKKEFRELKEELTPVKLFTRGAKKDLAEHGEELFGLTAGHFASAVTKAIFLRRADFLSRLIVPSFVQNVTTKFISQNKSRILSAINYLAKRNHTSNGEKANREDPISHPD